MIWMRVRTFDTLYQFKKVPLYNYTQILWRIWWRTESFENFKRLLWISSYMFAHTKRESIKEPLHLWRHLQTEFEYTDIEFSICRRRQRCQDSSIDPITSSILNDFLERVPSHDSLTNLTLLLLDDFHHHEIACFFTSPMHYALLGWERSFKVIWGYPLHFEKIIFFFQRWLFIKIWIYFAFG